MFKNYDNNSIYSCKDVGKNPFRFLFYLKMNVIERMFHPFFLQFIIDEISSEYWDR